jgi:hypothetical protein
VLLRVVVKRTQLTRLVFERNQGRTISMSAMKAGMSRNTARKYLRQNEVIEQRQVPHTWRTRQDPLEAVWEQALTMLRDALELEAKALLVQPASELGQEGAALCEEIAAEGDRFLLGERQLRRIFFG